MILCGQWAKSWDDLRGRPQCLIRAMANDGMNQGGAARSGFRAGGGRPSGDRRGLDGAKIRRSNMEVNLTATVLRKKMAPHQGRSVGGHKLDSGGGQCCRRSHKRKNCPIRNVPRSSPPPVPTASFTSEEGADTASFSRRTGVIRRQGARTAVGRQRGIRLPRPTGFQKPRGGS